MWTYMYILTLSQSNSCLRHSFEKTVGKGSFSCVLSKRIVLVRTSCPFPTVLSSLFENFTPFSLNLKLMCRLQTLAVWKSLTIVFGEELRALAVS